MEKNLCDNSTTSREMTANAAKLIRYPNLQNSSKTAKCQKVEKSSEDQRVNSETSSKHLSSDVLIHASGD